MLQHLVENCYQLMGSTFLMLMMIMIMTTNVKAKPEESDGFQNAASQALAVAGNMAEMMGNPSMMSKNTGFEVPFAKANSETAVGNGAAFRKDDDSSEEDRRRRKKRFALFEPSYNDVLGEETLLAVPHVHRDKRSPCHTGGGGVGAPAGDYDDNIAERRRAKKRKAAAKKKASKAKKTKSRRKIINLVSEDVDQALTRRKRQTEVDDLNPNTSNDSKDFSQYAQQIAEKVRKAMDGLMSSMNDMMQKFQQHFSGESGQTNAEEI